MAHTPGPWGIVFHGDVERIRLNGSTVYQVSDVTAPDFPSGQPRYCLDDLRLIAAAPELLAIAKWVRDNMEPLGKDPSDGVGGWRHMDATEVDSIVSGVLHFCDEAIATAEGRADDQG